MVYAIHKALIGLKQYGEVEHRGEWMVLRYGLNRLNTEPCLYCYNGDGKYVLVLLYVDGILLGTNNETYKKKYLIIWTGTMV